MPAIETFDTVVVGGGPAGATAAWDLARQGRSVLLLDRAGRTKPCGGAIPPRLVADFDIPDHLLVARITSARMVAPSNAKVDIAIDNGFVGMVDREHFDAWLRARAKSAGAELRAGTFHTLRRDETGMAMIEYRAPGSDSQDSLCQVKARSIVGADGALSAVARVAMPGTRRPKHVFAYHEIIRTPQRDTKSPDANAAQPHVVPFDGTRCDVIYRGETSPDFYCWVFPHGDTTSVGTGSAQKGFSLKAAVARVRSANGLADAETLRREGAPIPLKPLKTWDNGRDVVLAGDAAGVVAPSSGEGIYYAMLGGRLAAEAVGELLTTGKPSALKLARRRFMREHGRVFWVLGMMQYFWYQNDQRRERFVSMCRDRDVQKLTFDAYMNKQLVRAKPLAHVRIFFKDLAHLCGIVRT